MSDVLITVVWNGTAEKKLIARPKPFTGTISQQNEDLYAVDMGAISEIIRKRKLLGHLKGGLYRPLKEDRIG